MARQQSLKAQLEEARKKQFLEKDQLLKEQAKKDRELTLWANQKHKEAEEIERKENEHKKMALLQNKTTLLQQIDRNNRRKKELDLEYQEDGKRQKEVLKENIDKLVNIQHDKVNVLKQEGIAEKYMRELQNHKIAF